MSLRTSFKVRVLGLAWRSRFFSPLSRLPRSFLCFSARRVRAPRMLLRDTVIFITAMTEYLLRLIFLPLLVRMSLVITSHMRPAPAMPKNNPLRLIHTSDFPVRGIFGSSKYGEFLKFTSPTWCFYEAYRRVIFTPFFSAESFADSILPAKFRTSELKRALYDDLVARFVDWGLPHFSAQDPFSRASELGSFLFRLVQIFRDELLSCCRNISSGLDAQSSADGLVIDLLLLYYARFHE